MSTGTLNTREYYAEGYENGVYWAEQDQADGLGLMSEWLETFREESRSRQTWARAYYLGALRGYRSVTRTLAGGKWGT